MDQTSSNPDYLSIAALLVALLALFPVVSGWRKQKRDDILKQLDDAKDRPRIHTELVSNPSAFERYVDGVARLSDQFGKFFGPQWSWKALDKCLIFALIYPLTLLMIAWTFGMPGKVGMAQLLPDLSQWRRYLVLFVFVTNGFLLWVFIRNNGVNRAQKIVENHILLNNKGVRTGSFEEKTIRIIVSFIVYFAILFALVLMANFYAKVVSDSNSVLYAFGVAIAISTALSIGSAMALLVGLILPALLFVLSDRSSFELVSVIVSYSIFVVALPIANGTMDWLSWGATRTLLAKFHNQGPTMRSPAWIAGAIFLDLLIAIACLAGLCVLMALILEALNQFFLWHGMPAINWRGQVALAVEYPLTKGILVTGMLVTTLIPTMIHIAVGLEHAFTAPTPDTRAAAALIKDDMSAGDKQFVADVMVARDWYLYPCFAFAAILVLALAALIGLGAAPLGLTLADIAYCSASLIDGQCPWTDGVTK
jgi:hypothetical protein